MKKPSIILRILWQLKRIRVGIWNFNELKLTPLRDLIINVSVILGAIYFIGARILTL